MKSIARRLAKLEAVTKSAELPPFVVTTVNEYGETRTEAIYLTAGPNV